MTTRRLFLISWLAFTAAAAIWSLATPTVGGTDEGAHVVKAAGVVRGELLGATRGFPSSSPLTTMTVPASYDNLQSLVACYAGRPDVSASCAPALRHPAGQRGVATPAGRYPPLYYVLVGVPSLVVGPLEALLGMRLLSAALCGLCFAAAVTLAVRAGRPLLAVAVSIAATPQVLFLAGTVNPNGLEIAAAVLVWTCALLTFSERRSVPSRWLTAAFAVALAVLMLSRSLSPLWAALIVGVVLVASPVGNVWYVLRSRRAVIIGGAGALSGALAVAWIVLAHALDLAPDRQFSHISLGLAVRGVFTDTPAYIDQLIGPVGYLDTPVSNLAIIAWLAVVGLLMLLALAVGTTRQRVGLLLVAVGVVVIPIVLSAPTVHSVGYAWQGRYTLPFAVGLPLLAAAGLDEHPAFTAYFRHQLTVVIAVLLGASEALSVENALHRWAEGVAGPLDLFENPWRSTPTTALLVTATLIAYAGYRWWTVVLGDRAARDLDSRDPRAVAAPATAPPDR